MSGSPSPFGTNAQQGSMIGLPRTEWLNELSLQADSAMIYTICSAINGCALHGGFIRPCRAGVRDKSCPGSGFPLHALLAISAYLARQHDELRSSALPPSSPERQAAEQRLTEIRSRLRELHALHESGSRLLEERSTAEEATKVGVIATGLVGKARLRWVAPQTCTPSLVRTWASGRKSGSG